MSPELKRKLDHFLFVERLLRVRDAIVGLGTIVSIGVGVAFFTDHPAIRTRATVWMGLAYGGGLLMILTLTLAGRRKFAASVLFGSEAKRRGERRRPRPPPIVRTLGEAPAPAVRWTLAAPIRAETHTPTDGTE